MKTLLLTLLTLGLFNISRAGEIDVMHFWVSPSERNAIAVFIEAYEKNGDVWIDDTQENYAALRRNGLERFSDGFPPTAMHWVASENLTALISSGVLRTFDQQNLPKALAQLHPVLLDAVTFDGKIGAIPVSLHGENWAYYNADIMHALSLQPPTTWDEFFAQMTLVEQAGKKTVAIGSGLWELDIAFKSMLVAAGGLPLINALVYGDIDANNQVQLKNAFENFIRFRQLVKRSGLQTDSWDIASIAVKNGDAAVQLMGDWAKAEIMYAGGQLGEDFLCAMAPGNDDVYLMGIDTFVLPTTTSEAEQTSQQDFIDVILDPKNQIEFSKRKGTIPVRRDVDPNTLDACAKIGYNILLDKNVIPPEQIESSLSLYVVALGGIVRKVWSDEITSGKDAAEALIKEINLIHKI